LYARQTVCRESQERLFIPYTQPIWFAPYGGSGRADLQPLLVSNLNLLCRTGVPALSLASLVKRKLQEIDPTVAVSGVTSMDEVLNDAVSDPHFSVLLLGLFSALALLLAAVGIYGVISFSVSHRTHEIGIRMALGAGIGQVQWMIVRSALRIILLGLGAVLRPSRAYLIHTTVVTLLYPRIILGYHQGVHRPPGHTA
jgi:putative ABC transport system permease protein